MSDEPMSPEPVSPEISALAAGLFEALARVMAGIQQPRSDTQGDGATRSQLAALRVLAARESCTMHELAEGVGVTSPTMTSTVKLLVKKGYVERRHGEEDWRTVRITITPLGQEVQRQAKDLRSLNLARTVQALTPDQHAMLMVALPALRALADQVSPA